MTIYGYARVSTLEQSLTAQVDELTAAGCDQIFQEKISGAKRDRAQLNKLLSVLKEGDTLVVVRLDRFARSTLDLLTMVATIAERRAAFRSLRDAWADTTTPHGRLILTVLGGLAEFERELILTRTGEGKVRAKARGVKFGRKPKLDRFQQEQAKKMRADGVCLADIAGTFGVHKSAICRMGH